MTWDEHLAAVAALIDELERGDAVDWSAPELPARPSAPLSVHHAERALLVSTRLDQLIARLEAEQARVADELATAGRFLAGGEPAATIVDAHG